MVQTSNKARTHCSGLPPLRKSNKEAASMQHADDPGCWRDIIKVPFCMPLRQETYKLLDQCYHNQSLFK
ncbi:hypothetical protein DBV15_05621 [Temnothorax longispinosus]|uniref:Uncharacterized protein n=1 Tax=Temnothorax longispinosus TaxID=300112 RepID=A0A4S2JZB5_9HYME|nr:hypothetical protein DBV15_05621 [Temnothorax longispinosus]